MLTCKIFITDAVDTGALNKISRRLLPFARRITKVVGRHVASAPGPHVEVEMRGARKAARLLGLSCVLALSGCSSINHSEGFSGERGQSFLFVAADGMPTTGSWSYTFLFQKVDLKTATLLQESVGVDFTGFGPIGGNEFEKPKNLVTTIRFGGEIVSAGDYALISRIDNVTYGSSSKANRNCFNRNAPIFHVEPREIAIIPTTNVMTSEPLDAVRTEKQAMQVLANYPKYSAPTSVAKVVGQIAFETGISILGRPTCNPRGPFRLGFSQTSPDLRRG